MDLQPRVQVVLGEAERTDGLLQFVLEGEGFDIVGLASDDRELARVLRGARPGVIVLDGGISATAALEARRSSPGAALVVVWPEGVSAVLAEERVDPHLVIPDLGEAVRKAARRAAPIEPRIRVPEALHIATTVRDRRTLPPVRNEPPKPARAPRRGSGVLVAAATWLLILTALGTIAVAVPKAFDLFPRERAPRPSPSVTVTRPPAVRTPAPVPTTGTGQPPNCDPPAPDVRADPSPGRSNADRVRARGCPPGHGQGEKGQKGEKGGKSGKGQATNKEKDKDKGGAGGSTGQGGGPPDDPGAQANGAGSSDQTPRDGQGSGHASQGNGGSSKDPENAEASKADEHVPAETSGRTESGDPG
jgi:hypothetical protein